MRRALCWLLLGAIACGGPARPPVGHAGDDTDEGGGELARQSIQLELGGEDPGDVAEPRDSARSGAVGGDLYGGDPYGGDPYGGASYAGWTVPQWSYSTPNRVPHYNVSAALSGAIDGTVRWTGPAPGKLASACGTIDNPTVQVGTDHGVRGALVYIEKVSVGRPLPYYGRPASVGGIVVKHGCALLPAAQIVTPLPTSIAVHGDATPARVRITNEVDTTTYELQQGGLVQVPLKPGITRVEGEDGRLVAAWVLALDSPYYAITDDAGRFRIDELAPGTYDVTFWQAPTAHANADGTLGYGAPIVVHRTVKVEAARAARMDVVMSAR